MFAASFLRVHGDTAALFLGLPGGLVKTKRDVSRSNGFVHTLPHSVADWGDVTVEGAREIAESGGRIYRLTNVQSTYPWVTPPAEVYVVMHRAPKHRVVAHGTVYGIVDPKPVE